MYSLKTGDALLLTQAKDEKTKRGKVQRGAVELVVRARIKLVRQIIDQDDELKQIILGSDAIDISLVVSL